MEELVGMKLVFGKLIVCLSHFQYDNKYHYNLMDVEILIKVYSFSFILLALIHHPATKKEQSHMFIHHVCDLMHLYAVHELEHSTSVSNLGEHEFSLVFQYHHEAWHQSFVQRRESTFQSSNPSVY